MVALVIPLQRWRLAKPLTQEQLAARSGVGVSTIRRIEQGHPARITTVQKLLQALDLDERVLQEALTQQE